MKIKDSYDLMTLEDYFMLQSINSNETSTPLEKKIQTLSLLTGKDKAHFKDWSLDEIIVMYESFDFLNEEPKGDIQPYYTIGGKEYKLITNLKDLKASQFIDLNNYIKDKDLILDNMHMILAILLLPTVKLKPKQRLINKLNKVTNSLRRGSKIASNYLIQPILPSAEKYMHTPIEETAENIFKNITVTQAMGINTFFFAYSMIYIECSVDSLTLIQMQQLKSQLKNLKDQSEIMNHPAMKILEKNLNNLEDITNTGIGLL